jgi:hypothetical protein
VGASFVPYQTGGHWAYADDDYVWVSDYPWGWAPFHYGRWAYLGTGWGWIPGRVYAPAWVSWRVGAPGFGFVGWGPMAPTWGWRGGAVMNFGFGVEPRWSYCATGDLFNRGLSGRVLSGPRAGQAEAGTHAWSEGAGGHGGHFGGPPPGKLGIPNESVTHPSANDPGLAKAKGFSKPSSAVAQGGHAPNRGKVVTPRPENPGTTHGGGNETPSHGGGENPKGESPKGGNPGHGEPVHGAPSEPAHAGPSEPAHEHENPGVRPTAPPSGGGKHER